MSLVLYRKYRPRNFNEIIGQEHIVQTLLNAVRENRVAHAYLFSGPKGTGKTTIARILAKAVNCESITKNGQPCDKCEHCENINLGSALDIVEIDAASNRGIDEIRELREGIRTSPMHLKYKIYIIDEAHQLTKEAFNALLKTLEEPPEHAIFILATTSADKVPLTILSRLQRFDFKKFSVDQIVEKLEAIIKKEGVKADKEALRLVAVSAQGGLRDAESMLSQIVSHSNDTITIALVENILGIAGIERVMRFSEFLINNDLQGALKDLNKFHNDGGDVEKFFEALINYTRKALLLKLDDKLRSSIAPELTDDQFSLIMTQVKQFKREQLEKLLKAFIEAQNNIKKVSSPILPIELALIEVLGE